MIARGNIRAALLAFALVTALGGVGLVLTASSDDRATAFSLNVPNSAPAIVVAAGERVCQGPITAESAFGRLRLWLGNIRPPGATLAVNASTGAGLSLAAGTVAGSAGPSSALTIALNRVVPRGARIELCFSNRGPVRVPLAGGNPSRTSGMLVRDGRRTGSAAAMVMLSPHPRSMLALLPTVFERAAVFRPSWIGAWTYWILLVAVIGAFPVAALALRLAIGEDADSQA